MHTPRRPALFYGWYIVATSFVVQLACPFYLSSTLGVLLKSITTDLGVSRGTFSLMRSLELVAYAAVSPWVGSLLDRYGARGLMVIGAAISVVGFLMLGYARNFWEFTLLRVGPVSIGHALVCYFVINVTISRWFVKKRGRAVAIAHLGQGLSKTTISVVAAYLLTAIGWRRMWMLFGGLVVFLILIPAALFMRRSPEDMGLHPDGAPGPYEADAASNPDASRRRPAPADTTWTRREAVGTSAFWFITLIFSTVDLGIAGFNLHVFSFISDMGYSIPQAGTVVMVMAGTQLGSGLLLGFISDTQVDGTDVRRSGGGTRRGHADRRTDVAVCRLLPLRLRSRGHAGSSGSDVGQLLRPDIPGHRPGSQRTHTPALRRRRRPLLRLPLRLHRQL